jgi:hypothetical protein
MSAAYNHIISNVARHKATAAIQNLHQVAQHVLSSIVAVSFHTMASLGATAICID